MSDNEQPGCSHSFYSSPCDNPGPPRESASSTSQATAVENQERRLYNRSSQRIMDWERIEQNWSGYSVSNASWRVQPQVNQTLASRVHKHSKKGKGIGKGQKKKEREAAAAAVAAAAETAEAASSEATTSNENMEDDGEPLVPDGFYTSSYDEPIPPSHSPYDEPMPSTSYSNIYDEPMPSTSYAFNGPMPGRFFPYGEPRPSTSHTFGDPRPSTSLSRNDEAPTCKPLDLSMKDQESTSLYDPDLLELEIIEPFESTVVLYCQPTTLACKVHGVVKNSTWFKNGIQISSDHRVQTAQDEQMYYLIMSEALYQDHGVYMFEVTNDYQYRSCSGKLYVGIPKRPMAICTGPNPRHALDWGKQLKPVTVSVGDSIELKAVFNSTNVVKYRWFKNEILLTHPRVLIFSTLNRSNLTVLDAKITDTGIYTVVSRTQFGITSSATAVRVVDKCVTALMFCESPPVVEEGPTDAVAHIGEDVRLFCKARTNYRSKVEWCRSPNREMDIENHFKVRDYGDGYITLTIHGIRIQDGCDFGIRITDELMKKDYVKLCRVELLYNNVTEYITLKKPLSSYALAYGASVTLDCAFETSGGDNFFVCWYVGHYKVYRTDSKFKVGFYNGTCLLKILKMEPGMSGEVVCELRTALTENDYCVNAISSCNLAIVPHSVLMDDVAVLVREPPCQIMSGSYSKWSSRGLLLTSITEIFESDPPVHQVLLPPNQILFYIEFCRLDDDDYYYLKVTKELHDNRWIIMRVFRGRRYDLLENIWEDVVRFTWEIQGSKNPDNNRIWYKIHFQSSDGSYRPNGVTSAPEFVYVNPAIGLAARFRISSALADDVTRDTSVEIIHREDPPRSPDNSDPSSTLTQVEKDEMCELIVEGSYGPVSPTAMQAAMETMKLDDDKPGSTHYSAMGELRSIKYTNVVTLTDAHREDIAGKMILENIRARELHYRLLDNYLHSTHLLWSDVIPFIRQLCDFLNTRNKARSSLNSQNVLCVHPDNRQIELFDFGLARSVAIRGTNCVLPDTYNNEQLSVTREMWSLGVLVYMLLSGVPSVHAESWTEDFNRIIRQSKTLLTTEEALCHPWLREELHDYSNNSSEWDGSYGERTPSPPFNYPDGGAENVDLSLLLDIPIDEDRLQELFPNLDAIEVWPVTPESSSPSESSSTESSTSDSGSELGSGLSSRSRSQSPERTPTHSLELSPRSPEESPPRSPEDSPRSPEDSPRSPEDLPRSPEYSPRSPEDLPRSPEESAPSQEDSPRFPVETARDPMESPRSPAETPHSPAEIPHSPAESPQSSLLYSPRSPDESPPRSIRESPHSQDESQISFEDSIVCIRHDVGSPHSVLHLEHSLDNSSSLIPPHSPEESADSLVFSPRTPEDSPPRSRSPLSEWSPSRLGSPLPLLDYSERSPSHSPTPSSSWIFQFPVRRSMRFMTWRPTRRPLWQTTQSSREMPHPLQSPRHQEPSIPLLRLSWATRQRLSQTPARVWQNTMRYPSRATAQRPSRSPMRRATARSQHSRSSRSGTPARRINRATVSQRLSRASMSSRSASPRRRMSRATVANRPWRSSMHSPVQRSRQAMARRQSLSPIPSTSGTVVRRRSRPTTRRPHRTAAQPLHHSTPSPSRSLEQRPTQAVVQRPSRSLVRRPFPSPVRQPTRHSIQSPPRSSMTGTCLQSGHSTLWSPLSTATVRWTPPQSSSWPRQLSPSWMPMQSMAAETETQSSPSPTPPPTPPRWRSLEPARMGRSRLWPRHGPPHMPVPRLTTPFDLYTPEEPTSLSPPLPPLMASQPAPSFPPSPS